MKRKYIINDEAGEAWVRDRVMHDEAGNTPGAGDEVELELRAEQEKAMVAAGWISRVDEEEDDKGKGK